MAKAPLKAHQLTKPLLTLLVRALARWEDYASGGYVYSWTSYPAGRGSAKQFKAACNAGLFAPVASDVVAAGDEDTTFWLTEAGAAIVQRWHTNGVKYGEVAWKKGGESIDKLRLRKYVLFDSPDTSPMAYLQAQAVLPINLKSPLDTYWQGGVNAIKDSRILVGTLMEDAYNYLEDRAQQVTRAHLKSLRLTALTTLRIVMTLVASKHISYNSNVPPAVLNGDGSITLVEQDQYEDHVYLMGKPTGVPDLRCAYRLRLWDLAKELKFGIKYGYSSSGINEWTRSRWADIALFRTATGRKRLEAAIAEAEFLLKHCDSSATTLLGGTTLLVTCPGCQTLYYPSNGLTCVDCNLRFCHDCVTHDDAAFAVHCGDHITVGEVVVSGKPSFPEDARCWGCNEHLDSETAKQCSVCGRYFCPDCNYGATNKAPATCLDHNDPPEYLPASPLVPYCQHHKVQHGHTETCFEGVTSTTGTYQCEHCGTVGHKLASGHVCGECHKFYCSQCVEITGNEPDVSSSPDERTPLERFQNPLGWNLEAWLKQQIKLLTDTLTSDNFQEVMGSLLLQCWHLANLVPNKYLTGYIPCKQAGTLDLDEVATQARYELCHELRARLFDLLEDLASGFRKDDTYQTEWLGVQKTAYASFYDQFSTTADVIAFRVSYALESWGEDGRPSVKIRLWHSGLSGPAGNELSWNGVYVGVLPGNDNLHGVLQTMHTECTTAYVNLTTAEAPAVVTPVVVTQNLAALLQDPQWRARPVSLEDPFGFTFDPVEQACILSLADAVAAPLTSLRDLLTYLSWWAWRWQPGKPALRKFVLDCLGHVVENPPGPSSATNAVCYEGNDGAHCSLYYNPYDKLYRFREYADGDSPDVVWSYDCLRVDPVYTAHLLDYVRNVHERLIEAPPVPEGTPTRHLVLPPRAMGYQHGELKRAIKAGTLDPHELRVTREHTQTCTELEIWHKDADYRIYEGSSVCLAEVLLELLGVTC